VRAVVDTNVLVSGLLWQGPSRTLIEHVRDGRLSLVTNPALLAELGDVLERPKFDDVLHDLLALRAYQGISVVTPADALSLLTTSSRRGRP